MAPSLSGNTLGLKFMQRAAQKKAAAAPVAAPVEVPVAKEAPEEESPFPRASTSKYVRPAVTVESSYLAFPILSSAYGVEGGGSGNTSGRMTFGVQEDDEPGKRTAVSGTEKEELEADDIAKPAKPAKPEGFRKPAAYDEPIRKRKQETKQEEEDDNFADEMIEEARRKRQSKVTEAEAKPKKQRKKAKAEQGE